LQRTIYITGTSTGVGKTVATAALLRLAGRHGIRCVGLKPIATGARRPGPGAPLRNDDALELQAAGSVPLDYETVNPWCFEPAVAPHLAAREAGTALELHTQVAWLQGAAAAADLRLVEGVGGWRVPLHPTGFTSDLPETLGLDVVLVVGLTLGCLNHARLTVDAIERGGRCRLEGWIANEVDPAFERCEENVASLEDLLGAAPLARIPDLRAAPRSPNGVPVHDLADDPRVLATLGLATAIDDRFGPG
jgi:dethiobiotin synthetase